MLARFDEADRGRARTGDRFRRPDGRCAADALSASIAASAGRHEAAVDLRRNCGKLEARGLRGARRPSRRRWAAPLMVGRYDEAEPLARLARELAARRTTRRPDALAAGASTRRGPPRQLREAEHSPVKPPVDRDSTDGLNWQGDALCDLGEVLHAAGRDDEAEAASPRRSSAMNAGATLPRQRRCATAWLRSGANLRANRPGQRRRRAAP